MLSLVDFDAFYWKICDVLLHRTGEALRLWLINSDIEKSKMDSDFGSFLSAII